MATTVDSRRETVSLIGSDKVEGTAVYGADERGLLSAALVQPKIRYQPWRIPRRRYRGPAKGAPKYSHSTEWDWSNRSRDREVYDYYKMPL
jgi:hypothetical protein